VTLTFTEEPEAGFAAVQLLDVAGKTVPGTGPAVAVPGQLATLRVPLGPLTTGVYTVSWRMVSRVDGHVTGGTFAFGVGVSPLEVSPAAQSTPTASPLAVPGRIAFYVGAMGLLGSAWVWAVVRNLPGGAHRWLWLFWVIAVGGLLAFAQAQRIDAGVPWAQLFGSAIGRALLWRALPLLLTGGGIVFVGGEHAPSRRSALVVVGTCAVTLMLVHVAAGHAGASGDWRGVKIAVQWAHFVAVGIWVGGLAALLLALRGAPDDEKARAARRFSTVAGVALGVVALTGIVRAVDEVGAFSRLLTTPFGQLIVLKSILLLALALLGAANRYWSVPAVGRTLLGLKRVGGTELVVALIVLAVTGFLTGLAPASYTREVAGQASSFVVSGNDFATSIRATLGVAPGYPGLNRFTASLRDYDAGTPISADRVTVRFTLQSRPDIAPSSLPLAEGPKGIYRGQGSNMSVSGQWTAVLVVERGANSTEVPLALTTRTRPQQVRAIRAAGQPTLYVVGFPDKRSVQVYLDPERPGSTQVHVTYFDERGNELPIAREITVRASQAEPPGSASLTTRLLPVRRFGPGHFIADATVGPRPLRLEIDATDPQGAPLQAALLIQL